MSVIALKLFLTFLALTLTYLTLKLFISGPKATHKAARSGHGLKQFWTAQSQNAHQSVRPTDAYIEGVSTRYVNGKMSTVCETAPTAKNLF